MKALATMTTLLLLQEVMEAPAKAARAKEDEATAKAKAKAVAKAAPRPWTTIGKVRPITIDEVLRPYPTVKATALKRPSARRSFLGLCQSEFLISVDSISIRFKSIFRFNFPVMSS